MEEWRQIKGFEDYQISNLGRFKGKQNRILKCSINHNGYLKFNLVNKKGEIKNKFIHRLVVEVFIGNIQDGFQVHHIDGDKLNNHVSNLQIIPFEQNAERKLYKSLKKKKRRLNERIIKVIETVEERFKITSIEELKKVLQKM